MWVRLALTVDPEEGKLVFDFTESDPQADFINVPLGQVWSSVSSGLLWCLPPGMPRNEGFFECLEIVTKPGTVLDPSIRRLLRRRPLSWAWRSRSASSWRWDR